MKKTEDIDEGMVTISVTAKKKHIEIIDEAVKHTGFSSRSSFMISCALEEARAILEDEED